MELTSILIGIVVGLATGFAIAKFLEKSNVSNLIKNAKKEAKNIISQVGLQLDYLEIVDPLSLKNLRNWQAQQICCVAAFCGEVRLIDNMLCESVKLT